MTARLVFESEEWSSQLIFQFKQLERRSLKKSGLQRDSNPWPPRYRCDALPTELFNEATHWERGQLIEFISSREEWNDVKFIWNNSYMNCGCRWKWRMIIAVIDDHHIYFTQRNLLLNSKQQKKNDRSPYSFARKWRFTSTGRSSRKGKAAIF